MRFPQPLQSAPLPQFVAEEIARIQQDMEDISGQHEVSRGMSPGSGVTAATAIAYLQDKDDSLMATTYDSIEAGLEKIARQALDIVNTYWDIPRTVRTVGLDSAFDVVELKGSQLEKGMDIKIEAGSALPTSRPARQALLMDLSDRQVISPQELLQYLEMGGTGRLVERMRINERQAQRENQKMKNIKDEDIQQYVMQLQQQFEEGLAENVDPQTGESFWNEDPKSWPPMIAVNDYDDHETHIRIHNDFRKGQEFEMLSTGVKQQFATHVAQHQAAISYQQFTMMQTGFPPNNGNPPPMPAQPPMQPPMGDASMGAVEGSAMPPEGGMPNG
jgi:hypothetical protein